MPSPKFPPVRSANPSPARLDAPPMISPAASTATNASSVSPDALSRPMMDAEMDAITASNYPRRRNSLLNGAAGRSITRPRGASLLLPIPQITTNTTATTTTTTTTTPITIERISEDRSESKSGTADSDAGGGWEDAWGDDGDDGGKDDDDDTSFSDEDLQDDEETGLTRRERRRKAQLRRERTLFDQRFVPPGRDGIGIGVRGDDDSTLFNAAGPPLTADERKKADKNVMQRLVVNGTLIGMWYLFSLSLSLYNKWMFGGHKLDFHFPLFTTSIHMLVQFVLSSLVLYFVPSLRPGHGINSSSSGEDEDGYKAAESEGGGSGGSGGGKKRIMTKMFYLTRIGPCGAATGLDIGMGNASLIFITLTFYTMCKSSSLAFVLLFAFLFRLETPTWRLVAIIATMTAGVVMMVAGEVEFDTRGFLLVIGAAFFSGFRWGLTQIMLLRNPATSNPFSSIFFLAPVMFVTLFSLAVPIEGVAGLPAGFGRLTDQFGVLRTIALILFPGMIAFFMTASEFALLQRTSVVTLSIAGIFKEVVTIATAALVFDDTLTAVNLLGLVITLAAITAYNYIKITKMRTQAQIDVIRSNGDVDSVTGIGMTSLTNPSEFDLAMLPSPLSNSASASASAPASASSPSPLSSTSPSSSSPMAAHGRSGGSSDAEQEADTEDAGLLHKHASEGAAIRR